MNTPKDSTGGCCPPPPCSADPFLEEVSDKIRRGEPVGMMEAIAAIEYQAARKVLPWWRKDALGWPIETFKGKPVKSAIRIICQNIRKVIFKPNIQPSARDWPEDAADLDNGRYWCHCGQCDERFIGHKQRHPKGNDP